MEDLLKKFLYTGVGLVSLTAEKFQKSVDKLVERGNLTKEEGAKMIEDLTKSTEEKKTEFENRLKETVESLLKKANFPTADDLNALNARIEALDAKLEEIKAAQKTETKPAAKKTQAKTTTRKTTTRTRKTKKAADE